MKRAALSDRNCMALSPLPEEAPRAIEVIPVTMPPEPTRIPRMLSARTVANRLDVSLTWVRGWHRRGLLPGVVLQASGGRGRLLFRETDIVRFLEERGISPENNETDEQGTS